MTGFEFVIGHLWSVSVQVAVLGLVLLVAERLVLRQSAPALRELMWWLVLLRLLMPAVWFAVPGVAGARELQHWFAQTAQAGPTGPAAGWAVAVWVGGAAWIAGFGVMAYRRELRRLHRGASAPPSHWRRSARAAARRLGLFRVPRLCATSSTLAPCVAGLLRPIVFVPVDSGDALDGPAREHVLLHEFAHLQRRDAWRGLAALVVQIVFWFHPMSWIAARRLALLRELGADARAVAVASDGVEAYGHTLLRWSSRPRAVTPRRLLATGFWGATRLRSRIEALGAPASNCAGRAGLAICALLVGTLMSAGLAAPARYHAIESLADPAADPAGDAEPLPGCLQQRYLVFMAMAAEEQSAVR